MEEQDESSSMTREKTPIVTNHMTTVHNTKHHFLEDFEDDDGQTPDKVREWEVEKARMSRLGEREGVLAGREQGEKDGYAQGFSSSMQREYELGMLLGAATIMLTKPGPGRASLLELRNRVEMLAKQVRDQEVVAGRQRQQQHSNVEEDFPPNLKESIAELRSLLVARGCHLDDD